MNPAWKIFSSLRNLSFGESYDVSSARKENSELLRSASYMLLPVGALELKDGGNVGTGQDTSANMKSTQEYTRNHRLGQINPLNCLKAERKVRKTSKSCSNKRQVWKVPAGSLRSAIFRGYLNKRNGNKMFTSYWCVLHDSCLYFYCSPTSTVTHDVILLRGYEVIADVTHPNKSRFGFHLKSKECPTIWLSANYYKSFLFWVGTIEREALRQTSLNYDEELRRRLRKNSISSSLSPYHDFIEGNSSSYTSVFTDYQVESEILNKETQNLLEEIVFTEQKMNEERKVLDSGDSSKVINYYFSHPISDLEKSENTLLWLEKNWESQNREATKALAFLIERRSSIQMKLNELWKEPYWNYSKGREIENYMKYASLQEETVEIKEELKDIDKEIERIQSNCKTALETILHERILEQLVERSRTLSEKYRFTPSTTPCASSDELPLASPKAVASERSNLHNSLATSSYGLSDKEIAHFWKRSNVTFHKLHEEDTSPDQGEPSADHENESNEKPFIREELLKYFGVPLDGTKCTLVRRLIDVHNQRVRHSVAQKEEWISNRIRRFGKLEVKMSHLQL